MARRTKLNYKIKKFIKENRFKFLILLFIIIWLQYSFSLVLMKIGKNPINAFIPGYNFYLFHRMAGVPLSWCFFNLTPTLLYYWPKTCVSFAKNFGKEKNFGYLLALLPVIFLYDLGSENVLKFQQNHHDNDDLDI